MPLRVNVTQIGTVALVITVGAAVVLFLAAGIRVAAPGAGRPPDGPRAGRAGTADETTERRHERRDVTAETAADATADPAHGPGRPREPRPAGRRRRRCCAPRSVMAAGHGGLPGPRLRPQRCAGGGARLGPDQLDTFTVANTVPNIIYILLAGGVLNAVFVPQLVRAMKDGPERSRAYTDRLLTLAGLVLLAHHRRRHARRTAGDRALHGRRPDARPTPTSRRCSRSGACRRSSSTASTRCSARCSTPAAASAR